MDIIYWYLLVLALILLWWFAAWLLAKKYREPLEKKNIAFQGPFVLWKTQVGRALIDRVAKKEKFVKVYGWLGTGITGVAMVTMTITLIIVAFYVFLLTEARVIEPHMLLGLPGVNPLIPLWYGIFGLAVAIIVHEFSHGILCRLADIKIKSLGLVFFVVPMGAFVEPDEDDIKAAAKKNRVRMFAVGPASNMIVAGFCAVMFSVVMMSAVTVAHDGVGITNVSDSITIESQNFTIPTPANISGLKPGMIIYSINGTAVYDHGDLSDALNQTRPNQTVEVQYYFNEGQVTQQINLTFKGYYWWDLYDNNYGDNYTRALLERRDWGYSQDNVSKIYDWYVNKGYLGVETMDLTTAAYHPFSGADEQGGILRSIAVYVTLPLSQKSPISGTTTEFYEISGFWSALPEGAFWTLANAFYWLFWLNLMVGLTNALPAVPLDGGYIYRDWLDSIYKKLRPNQEEEKRVRTVDGITIATAFFILFLILWQIIGPRIL